METRKTGTTVLVIACIAIALVAVNTALGYLLAQQSEQALGDQIRARMMETATAAAELLDGDELEKITAQDEGTPAYDQAMETLRAFQSSEDLSYIYCVRETPGGTFEFTIDATVADPADFGEAVQYTDALGQAAKGVAAVDMVAYNDRWGRFYSAYCPVFDSEGNVASIVGVDFEASWYEEQVAMTNHMVIAGCALMLLAAILAIFVAYLFARAQTRQMGRMLDTSRHDPLTGLPNMSYFFELAPNVRNELAASGRQAAILYMDLIDLRSFNQKRGFALGDELLEEFGKMLAGRFGKQRCGRFGQDHFAVIAPAENLEELLASLASDSENLLGGEGLPLCIGVYIVPAGEWDARSACDRAKLACSLNAGAYSSSWLYFEDEMLKQAARRQYFIDNLDRAIDENWVKVHYQPIVRAASGHVCDEEALARWDDPEHGMISPAEFIPALEGAKLIYKLDLNVLEQTLAKMSAMAEQGYFIVPASVNLSRSDFETCDIVEEVRKRVDEAGIRRDMISVEITETSLGQNFDYMKEQVERFHQLGFRVWMDDFGSEYSSLDYLQSIRFDLIKFDMQFMRQFDNGQKSKVILTELVKMAAGLGIDTIVEGVETEEQVEFLREVGCSKLQGFYFSKPNPLEEIYRRYEEGFAIGFENPAESEYYAAMGGVNLYDLSSVTRSDGEGLGHYFSTLPMAVMEFADDGFTIVRCNPTYRSFMQNELDEFSVGERIPYERSLTMGGSAFLEAVRSRSLGAEQAVVDESLREGVNVHALTRRIAVNPVTKTTAAVVAILAISE